MLNMKGVYNQNSETGSKHNVCIPEFLCCLSHLELLCIVNSFIFMDIFLKMDNFMGAYID